MVPDEDVETRQQLGARQRRRLKARASGSRFVIFVFLVMLISSRCVFLSGSVNGRCE